MNELVTVRGLTRAYRAAGRTLPVLQNLDLDVARAEMVAVVGDSGVGKSTLLHLLGALDRPDGGSYLFQGREVFLGGPEDLAAFRNRDIGFVFQTHNLLPEFTAVENVMIAGLIGRRPRDEVRARAEELLRELGVGDRLGHVPAQLSGGEQQRVSIARALMTAGSLLLADEPTGNLDPGTAERVFDLMRTVQRTRHLSVIMATHNERLAALCDRILLLRNGALTPVTVRPVPRQEISAP
jgi:lipoprotein-releasing system ATP-binding protein